MKVRIYQGANAKYRDDLYSAMVRQAEGGTLNLTVLADRVDHLGVKSVDCTTGYEADYCLRTRLIGTGRFQVIWYRGWPATESDTDVVVLDGNPRVLNNFIEARNCRKLGIPVVWWGQGFAAGSRGFASRLRIELMRLKLFSHIVLYTDREREQFVRFGFEQERISALNNGINVVAVRSAIDTWTADNLAEFQKQHGLAGRTWIVFLGRLRRRSAVELLPQVLSNLPDSVGLIIVGDGSLRVEISQEFTAKGLADRVRWAGAIYTEEAMAPWMLSAACMFYPGTIGLSLIHALAYGLPVVIHDKEMDHGPEIAAFRDGVNGFAFKLSDGAEGAAASIRALLTNKNRLLSMKEAASASVQETFNVQDMARRFQRALDACVSRS